MRKLIFLTLLIFSVPAYSVVLVYKLTTPFNPLVVTTASNPSVASVSKTTFTTWLIFDVPFNSNAVTISASTRNGIFDVATLPTTNGSPRLNLISQPVTVPTVGTSTSARATAITTGRLNGHNFQTRIGGTSLNSEVNISSNAEANSINIFRVQNSTVTNQMLFIDIVEANSVMISAQLLGRVNRFVVQNTRSILVASTLKGNSEIFDLTGRIAGLGTATLTLSTSWTDAARTRRLTVAQTRTALQTAITRSGFPTTTSFP